MNIQDTQILLERLGGLLRADTRAQLSPDGLLPVQFDALFYLSVCNRYSDTPMAVTEYLGQTKGTVSQTLKVLEKKGFIVKKPDANDKRITHMSITEAGVSIVKKVMPAKVLSNAESFLSDDKIAELNQTLKLLLGSVQSANGFKSFGQCGTCQHNEQQEDGGYLCGLTKEALSYQDTQLICKEHSLG